MRNALTVMTVLWAAGAAGGTAAETGGPALTSGPSAVRDGDKVKISFAASAPTDVEVAVLDAEGGVVRHLAAGCSARMRRRR